MERTVATSAFYKIVNKVKKFIVYSTNWMVYTMEQLLLLTGQINDYWVPVTVDKIDCIESMEKKTWFYSGNERFRMKFTLKELADRLPANFIRTHRSYIINMRSISRISKDYMNTYQIQLKNGMSVPISQSYLADVRVHLQL